MPKLEKNYRRGGLEPVLFLARTDDPEIHREVLPALYTLSFAEANKAEITKHGGFPLLSMVPDVNPRSIAASVLLPYNL